MSGVQATGKVKAQSISAVVYRVDGRVEDLGVVACTHSSKLARLKCPDCRRLKKEKRNV